MNILIMMLRRYFKVENIETEESPLCIAGEVLQGIKKPIECSAFGKECTPERPLGAPMVSTEGACAAYFHYGKVKKEKDVIANP